MNNKFINESFFIVNSNAGLKLTVMRSNLNQFHSNLTENDEIIKEKLEPYFPNTNSNLTNIKILKMELNL